MAHTTPSTGSSGSGSVDSMDGFVDFLKSVTGFNLTDIRSIATPTIRRLAERLADELKEKFPSDHFLRSDWMEIAGDLVAKRFKEAQAATRWGGVAVQEIGEFVSAFVQAFSAEDEGSRRRKREIPPEFLDAFKAVNIAFMERVALSVASAPPGAVKATVARLMDEAAGIRQVQDALLFGPEKPYVPKPPLADRIEASIRRADNFAARLVAQATPVADELKTMAEDARRTRTATKPRGPKGTKWWQKALDIPYWVGWVLDLPWKCIRLITGF